MESLLEMSEAGIRSNIAHFQAVRNKHAEEAIKAYTEEIKWRQILELKNNPSSALKDLLTTDCI